MSLGVLAVERCYGEIESRGMWDIEDTEHLDLLLEGIDATLEGLATIIGSAQE